MAEDRIDPRDQIPETDLLQQQTPIEPPALIKPEPATMLVDST